MKVREICFGASCSKRSSVDEVAVDAYTVMLSLNAITQVNVIMIDVVTQDKVLFDDSTKDKVLFDDSMIRSKFRFGISQLVITTSN